MNMLRTSFPVLSLFAALGGVLLVTPGLSQTQNKTATQQSKTLELEAVQRKLTEARERQRALKEEIATLKNDVGAINRALVTASKRAQLLETEISQNETRLADLLKSQQEIQASLNKKRHLLAEVIAALQRLGKNPPPALLIRPDDALVSVRSSLLLGAVVPGIKEETDTLFAEMASLKQSALDISTTRKKLASDLNALAEDETRLSLLVAEKNQLTSKSKSDLLAEQRKSTDLAAKALSLKELIKSLESEITSAAEAAKAASRADERRRIEEAQRLSQTRKRLQSGATNSQPENSAARSSNMARIEPAIAFSKATGKILYPVSGVEIARFGTVEAGSRRTNVAFATRPNARVGAPSDGWIVYAGPFRSYGKIIILNAGEGYHLVLSGLAHVNVTPGRFVLSGEPIGRMGSTGFAATSLLDVGSNKPILTVELRKDGKPVDPTPWWVKRPQTELLPTSG